MKILSSRGVDGDSYNISIDSYRSNDLISQKVQFIDNLFAEFMREGEVNIHIPKELSENFLKIISNIFYLNLQKVTVDIKKDIFDKGVTVTSDEMKDFISKSYERHLTVTRKQVLRFFGVRANEIKSRTLLRAYTYMLSPFDQNRVVYEKYINLKEKITNDLANNNYDHRMLDSNSLEPRDEIISFEDFNI
jgi:hypothetical protein